MSDLRKTPECTSESATISVPGSAETSQAVTPSVVAPTEQPVQSSQADVKVSASETPPTPLSTGPVTPAPTAEQAATPAPATGQPNTPTPAPAQPAASTPACAQPVAPAPAVTQPTAPVSTSAPAPITPTQAQEDAQTQLPSWDLSDLYSCDDDPQIKADITRGAQLAQWFERNWHELLVRHIYTPLQLVQALQEYEQLNVVLAKPAAYTSLRFAIESQNTKLAALNQYCNEQISNILSNLIFFELELGKLSEAEWSRLQTVPQLMQYRHFMEELRITQKYNLSEPEEKILEQTANSGKRAFRRLFSELIARISFPMEVAGVTNELTESEILALSHSPKREVRCKAAQVLSQVLHENAHPIHFAYNTLLLDKITSDKLRGFNRPESARNLGNELDDATVDLVVQVVRDNYLIVADYYKLKAKILGLDKLYHYDRYAPLYDIQETISYERAKDIVRQAFNDFDPQFGNLVEPFFQRNWIDAKVVPGKRGGAFCEGIAPQFHPYVMLNYTGQVRDVQTLAHELGHGIHDLLASRQNYFNYHPVLPLAETASTFAEMIVFNKLFANLHTAKDKLSLLAAKIEDTFATVFRQVAMYSFEQRVYTARAQEGELSLERINEIWQASIAEMFGDSLELGPDHAITWIYVPHFVYTPFYVYAYAFGELLVYSFFARYRREGEAFKQKYLQFLASGGSENPRTLLAGLGINIDSREFWQEGCDLIAESVNRAKELADDVEREYFIEQDRLDAEAREAGKSRSGWGEGDDDGWDGYGEDDEDPDEWDLTKR